jgi:hypothetical protein
MKSNHPAVITHLNTMVLRLGTQYPATPEDILEESMNVPNHESLIPYLEQLPLGVEYRILDSEGVYLPQEKELLEKLRDAGFGLVVEFPGTPVQPAPADSPDVSFECYGGCQLVRIPTTFSLGLRIYVNGCEASSAPEYYVIPKD